MIYAKSELVRLSEDVAQKESLDAAFVCSVIEALSAWNPAMVEQDPSPAQYNPALGLLGRNPQGRVGLLQITEAQAAELGYKETGEALTEPTLNVRIGCQFLKKVLAQAGGQADRALLLMYGYSVSALIPKIRNKISTYKIFLASKPE